MHLKRSISLSCAALATLLTAACGGGGSDVLGNPPTVTNAIQTSGQALSFAYFQRCIQPILQAQLPSLSGGGSNTCAGSGCHDNSAGTGGALRLFPAAAVLDVTDPANTAAVIRASDMYKNFYSSQAASIIGSSAQSRLLSKPLLRGVLHGGGQIFSSESDANAVLMAYWINHPVPQGQDEFSTASYSMFTPGDPNSGSCNTQ
jgi:ADP-ribosylglycohydrolase